ncbi:MAG TPA: di-heme oxidoredictase family protein [Vicinamibacteria bacterium]|nr:di-heme oxidoredictase family protein [Vicinamibacteria bacterium]
MSQRSALSATSCLGLLVLGVTVHPDRARAQARESKDPLPVIDLSGHPGFPLPRHLESSDIAAGKVTFRQVFDAGQALFHVEYTAEDGVGAMRLPDGSKILRFSRLPPGGGAGAEISSQSCVRCHVGSSSGPSQANVLSDPDNDGKPPFLVRNTSSLFGDGILQLLAQEVTEDLHAIKDDTERAAKARPGVKVERPLESKGVRYGTIAATAGASGNVTFDLSRVEGIDADLVVRPLGWKGNIPTVRLFNVGAAALVMSLQAEELVWKLAEKGAPPDADGDGVERELSVGDITAMAVYGAALETPQSAERLAELGLVQSLSAEDRARIERGRQAFASVGCASCHVPTMHLGNTVFEEPTLRGNGNYYDAMLAARDPGYDPKRPVRFDVLRDAKEPRAEADPKGGAIIRLYGDLKRHRMGRQLSDPTGPVVPFTAGFAPVVADGKPVPVGPSDFLTPELWGVGNTGPWLHDGRAASLREAIAGHGEDDPSPAGSPERSEAQEARDAFSGLAKEDQVALLTFLHSLQTFPLPSK